MLLLLHCYNLCWEKLSFIRFRKCTSFKRVWTQRIDVHGAILNIHHTKTIWTERPGFQSYFYSHYNLVGKGQLVILYLSCQHIWGTPPWNASFHWFSNFPNRLQHRFRETYIVGSRFLGLFFLLTRKSVADNIARLADFSLISPAWCKVLVDVTPTPRPATTLLTIPGVASPVPYVFHLPISNTSVKILPLAMASVTILMRQLRSCLPQHRNPGS